MENDVQAAPSAAPAEAMPITSMDAMSAPQRKAYLATGEFPTETNDSKPKSDAAPGQDADESGAASDAAGKDTQKQDPPRETRADRRIRETLAYSKRLEAELAEERAKNRKALEPAKPATTAKPADDPTEPQPEDYPTIPAYLAARDNWREAKKPANSREAAKEAAREVLREEKEQQQKEEREAEAKKTHEKVINTFTKRLAEYRKTLTDDKFNEHMAEVTNYCTTNRLRHLDDAISESEVGPQLVDYFGVHFEELEKLGAMSPNAALRELGRLEVSEKITGPAPKNRTAAKKLGSDVRGTGTTFDEDAELVEAAAKNDMKTYDRIMRKREAAESNR